MAGILRYTYGTASRRTWKDGREDGATHHDSFHPDPRDLMRARNVLYDVRRSGGATIDKGYRHDTRQTGYYVGGRQPNTLVIPVPDGLTMDAISAIAYDLSRFVTVQPIHPDTLIGLWLHNGALYIDAVTWHESVDDALHVAERRGEIAIWDIAESRDIFL